MLEYDMFEEVSFENEKQPLQGNQMIQDCVQKMVAELQSGGDGEHKQIHTNINPRRFKVKYDVTSIGRRKGFTFARYCWICIYIYRYIDWVWNPSFLNLSVVAGFSFLSTYVFMFQDLFSDHAAIHNHSMQETSIAYIFSRKHLRTQTQKIYIDTTLFWSYKWKQSS